MQKLRIFYNENRKKIWKIMIFVIFLILLYSLIRNIVIEKVRKENKINISNSQKFNEEKKNKKYKENDVIVKANKEFEYESTEDEKYLNGEEVTIKNFIDNINDGKVEESYNMLTDECKEIKYATVKDFKKNYVLQNFGYRVSYEIEKWINNTYRVNIFPDMLSTGNDAQGYKKQEYITIRKIKDEYKLNINNFIKREKVNAEKEFEGCKIRVNYRDVFMNYAVYNFSVENKSTHEIVLDELIDLNSMYLLTYSGHKNYAYNHEITKEELKIRPTEKREINIKYYSKYNSNNAISSVVFSKVRGNSMKIGEEYKKIKINL